MRWIFAMAQGFFSKGHTLLEMGMKACSAGTTALSL
jgi:hypothetical protein